MYDLIIRDATIVDAGTRLVADVAVEDGRIAVVGGAIAGGAKEEVSAIGRFLMPGAIDANVHVEGAAAGMDDWASATRAAVARGVTTILDMPSPDLPVQDVASARAKLERAAGASVACFGVWASVGDDGAGASEAWDAGLVCGLRLTVGAEDDEFALSLESLDALFASTRGLLGIRAEHPAVLEKARKRWQAVDDPVHNDVRPPKAAGAAVERIVQLVRQTGRSVHLCSLSTAAELNLLDPLRGDLPITTEVCPHHLYLSVDSNAGLGNLMKTDPPVRGELDRRALWAAVKRGRVDTFASDHRAHGLEAKGVGYWSAPSGVPGVETLWPLMMTAVKHGRVGLERVVDMCAEAPARIFGLEGKGRIEEGADADLVLFAEGETARMQKRDVQSAARWSPYVGRDVGLPPELVVVNGRIVARQGALVDDLPLAPPVRYARTE